MNKKRSKGSDLKMLKIVAVTIALVIITYFGVSLYIANILTKPNNNPVTYDKYSIGKNVNDVAFNAIDGVHLSGWLFNGTNGRVIMFVHGAGNENRVNLGYKTPEIASFFINEGYSVLLFDLRGNGESQKTRLGLGQYEKNDVAGAFQFLEKKGYVPQSIGIISNSLGAISTIMAGNYVKTAGGIVLDSPATQIAPIVSMIMKKDHNVPKFMDFGVYFMANVFFKRNVYSVKPIDYIQEFANTPILFLHGTSDNIIPPINSLQLFEKAGHGQRILFEGADHVQTFATNPKLYEKVVGNFFKENLK